MKNLFCNKKYSGILWGIVITIAFVTISLLVRQFLSGTTWYFFSSILRIVFGIITLLVVVKIYDKPVKEVLSLKGSKRALIAGVGFIVYFVYYVTAWCIGIKSITGLTTGLLISQIILQQIATAFYEELHYRVLLLEGYFHGPQSTKQKLIYAFINFLLFGVIHVLTGWSTYRFIATGTIGFAFAVIYLKSGNIFIPMVFHFIYDIFANLTDYIDWRDSLLFAILNHYAVFYTLYAIMFAVSLVILLRKGNNDKENVTLPLQKHANG